MTDEQKEIEGMTQAILGEARCKGSCADCDLLTARKSNGEPYAICYPRKEAIRLYEAGYRKMDEITLKLDLGDRSAEEIQQIAEAFNKANEEEITKRVAKEIIQIMKQVQAMFYDKEYVAIQNLIAEKYGVEIEK